MARARNRLLVLPLTAGGILLGHDAGYRLAGVDPAGLHGYLSHAPQLLLALALPSVLVAVTARARPPRPWLIAAAGVLGFALLEHLERIVHGELPWLLTSPVFLLGLALQAPLALAAWWLARTLLELPPACRTRPPALSRLPVLFAPPSPQPAPVVACRAPRPRGPPAFL